MQSGHPDESLKGFITPDTRLLHVECGAAVMAEEITQLRKSGVLDDVVDRGGAWWDLFTELHLVLSQLELDWWKEAHLETTGSEFVCYHCGQEVL